MADSNLVNITIDGKAVQVPKGMNIIEAARLVGVEIPHYCYHPHLSVAGNCRMCQIKIEGQPKLNIACNTGAAEGMIVHTQEAAADVAEAQRATLEFLLINHPLDCTVCDQAGHCKLQDYYYEYNGKASRFIEEKVHKVKAEPLGPEVIYDGERCIVCTRCVRFCDEVTGTSELGVFNRGDQAVIGISNDRELDNPLAGSVVDLCPVGALTHRRWRFNSRVWYTDAQDSICTGCSTGCNARVHTRDGEVVQVKARLNSAVNQEWMCDEGRYGFGRFQPTNRLRDALLLKGDVYERVALETALDATTKLAGGPTAIFLSPFLTLEEMWVALEYATKVAGADVKGGHVAVQLVQRSLTETQAILISPDYAPNARAAQVLGLAEFSEGNDWRAQLEKRYRGLLEAVRLGHAKKILLVGDFAIRPADVDDGLLSALQNAELSVALGTSADELLTQVVIPSRTVNEKSGVMINRDLRLQRVNTLIQAPIGSTPEWSILRRMADKVKKPILAANIQDERALFREMVSQIELLKGVTLMTIGTGGLNLVEHAKSGAQAQQGVQSVGA